MSSVSDLAVKSGGFGNVSGRSLGTFLYERIQTGVLKPGDRIGTAKELSKEFNVSFGSARQSLEILAAKGVVVRKPRVGTFVGENSIKTAQTASANHSIVALLVPDLKQAEYAYITRYLQDEAHKLNLDLVVSSTDNDRERYDQTIRRQIESGVSGVILASPSYELISLETILELKNSGIPVVCFAKTLDGTGWPVVCSDVSHGTYVAVKHLLEIGRKHIAFVSYEGRSATLDSKLCGGYRALHEKGGKLGSLFELTVPLQFYSSALGWTNNPELRCFINDWLDDNSEIDAICCDHDHIAVSVIQVLQSRGVGVPDEIAVTGSCNLAQFYGLAEGELTTTDTCLPEKAAEMLRLLLAMRNGEKMESNLEIVSKPKLLLGSSSVAKKSDANK